MLLKEVEIGGGRLLKQDIGHPLRGGHTAREPAVGIHVQEDADRCMDPASSAATPRREAHLEVALDLRLVNGTR